MGLDAEIRYKPRHSKGESHTVAYWRKFNALQGFFEKLLDVQNCEESPCSLEDLETLRQTCLMKTLTPTEGFFFGSQEAVTDEQYEELLRLIPEWENLILEGNELHYWCWY